MRDRLGVVLLVLPLLVGVALMVVEGAPRSRWLVNVVAGGLGLLAFALLRRSARRDGVVRGYAAWLAVASVWATLAFPAADGVSRWLPLGPLHLHASAIAIPIVLVAAGRHTKDGRGDWLVLALAAALPLQPDAGQATALAIGAPFVLAQRRWAWVLVFLAGWAWWRPDDLGVAPYVEDVLPRAVSRGVAWVGLCVAALAAYAIAPLVVDRGSATHRAIAAYFVATIVVGFVGVFPVPLLGSGASPILGAFLALGLLSPRTAITANDRDDPTVPLRGDDAATAPAP